MNTRIAIVGAGNVGSTLSYTLALKGVADEICLIDLNYDKAYAEALDIRDANHFMSRNTDVWSGSYADTKDADVLVITAAAPMDKDAHSRLDALKPSMRIMDSIVSQVMETGFTGKIVVVSNPVDIMTYYVWKISGLPEGHVIGSGTALDTARLCKELSELTDIKSSCIDAYVLGEHGDSEVCAFSAAQIGAAPLVRLLGSSDKVDTLLAQSAKKTREGGWEIFNRKGNTCYGIASSTAAIVEALMCDKAVVLPVTSKISDMDGLDDVWMSLPCVLDREGVRQQIVPQLTSEELDKLTESANVLKGFYNELG